MNCKCTFKVNKCPSLSFEQSYFFAASTNNTIVYIVLKSLPFNKAVRNVITVIFAHIQCPELSSTASSNMCWHLEIFLWREQILLLAMQKSWLLALHYSQLQILRCPQAEHFRHIVLSAHLKTAHCREPSVKAKTTRALLYLYISNIVENK